MSIEPDASLDRAAAELALSAEDLSPGRLRRALRETGSDLVIAQAKWVSSSPERDAWLRSLAEGAEAPLCFGEAVTETGRVVVAAERAATLVIDDTAVTFRLAPGFREPYLVVRDRDGTRRVVPSSTNRFDFTPDAQPTDLQLVATGPSGPRPVARLGGTAQANAIARSGEPRERIERLRQRAGVPDLRRNRRLESAARRQAETVCEGGRVRHGPPDGDPEARLREHGLRARLVGEVAARASSVGRAFDAIVDSPSHELTLLDRRFTDVGSGVAEDQNGRSCLVVLLAAWPRAAAH